MTFWPKINGFPKLIVQHLYIHVNSGDPKFLTASVFEISCEKKQTNGGKKTLPRDCSRHGQLLYLLENVGILLVRLSATGWQLNNDIQLFIISGNFIQNIFLKALPIAKWSYLQFDSKL